MQYKIEMKYIYGWDDAGWTEEMDEESKPWRFKTAAQAQRALDECFANVKTALPLGIWTLKRHLMITELSRSMMGID